MDALGLKSPGDAIGGAGEVLLEGREPNKSTMEKRRRPGGSSAEIRFGGQGRLVPVGQVIAVISGEKPDAPTGPDEAPPAAASEPAEAEPVPETPAAASEPLASKATPPAASLLAPADGRVLASPKARRLAAERGLDLAALFAESAGQPIHVRDLDALAAKAAGRRATTSAAAPTTAPATAHAARLEARAPAAALAAFTTWLAGEGGGATSRAGVLAAFAAAGLRGAHDDAKTLVVAVETADGADPARYADADRARLAALAPSAQAPAPALVVRDLLDTPIVSARAGGLATPVLTLVPAGDEIALALDYAAGALDDRAAVALVTALAGRLAEPLRHLL